MEPYLESYLKTVRNLWLGNLYMVKYRILHKNNLYYVQYKIQVHGCEWEFVREKFFFKKEFIRQIDAKEYIDSVINGHIGYSIVYEQ